MRSVEDQTEHLLCLPSADQWAKREDQSIPGRIPATLLWEPAKGMGVLAAPSSIYPELLAKRVHQKIPVRTDPRIRTLSTSTIKRSKHPRHQQPTSAYQGSKGRSPTRAETNPRKDDQGNKVQRLRNWKQSMVGRDKHQTTLRQQETIPKAIR